MAFGRLERTAAPSPMSDINMTPLIDVMLVLLVIFIITAPLLASTIELELPSAAATQGRHTTRTISVAIDAAGNTYLDNQPVSLEELAERFVNVRKTHPDTEVQLRADQSVAYGRVVMVMGSAQKAGLNRIGFVTDPPEARSGKP
ncbi:MAG: biopolymer transporter ExbD [Rhodoferax sp.]|jgi:biopolymer transport protein TolR|uniref:ExbD/TolR family protein n=1 Tax=Rhodoferax sp. TaxID=50421 RepID=UPI001B48CF76|nr:biopolymer transporter ExbD [Rhodoferax sp.]MBP8285847.1 biopolymer transporter ExbD [Rhodoferax sp.]MBP9147366.1 biopolymer transporter ExbD [Rhodoferax sp.]MBP9736490.1 biopolymer transporter ExbD [Rhodoferax sp.]